MSVSPAGTAFFLGLGLQAYFLSTNITFLFLALLGGVGSVLLGVFYDTRYKAMLHKLDKVKKAEWVGYQDPLEKLKVVREKKINWAKQLFSLLYKTTEIHVALNIVSVIALLNLKWTHFLFMPWSYWIAFYYGILFPVIFILRSYDHIHHRKIETEFQTLFKF